MNEELTPGTSALERDQSAAINEALLISGLRQHELTEAAESLNERLQKEIAEHKSAQESFRTMADNIAQLAWMADPEGEVFWYNKRWFDYTGTTLEEMRGWQRVLRPQDFSRVISKWRDFLAHGVAWEDTFPIRGSDGHYRWFLSRAFPIRDDTGNVVRWFGTNTDIDDQRTASDALAQAKEQVEVASRAKDDFLAALSHELRTPLTPVLLTAAVLCEDMRLPSDVREQLRMIERNITLEARLIDDLLDLTKISQGKLKIRAEPCDARHLIGLAIGIVQGDARAKKIFIENTFDAPHGEMMADPTRFQQVMWNLLRNAIKFTPEHGGISVRTSEEKSANGSKWLRIEVTDTGIGIDPSQLDQIFLSFDQGGLTGDHRFGGVGLGLAIARVVVDLHGGQISALSAGRNCGSTFVVELPLGLESKATISSPDSPARADSVGAPSPPTTPPKIAPLRLLLVEDHESTLDVVSQLLRLTGHRVTTATNIKEALTAAAADQFDLVISDLGLPDGSGLELMEKLRNTYGLRGIALTGYGAEEDIARTRKAGFVTHLVKPISFDDLGREIARFLPVANQGAASA